MTITDEVSDRPEAGRSPEALTPQQEGGPDPQAFEFLGGVLGRYARWPSWRHRASIFMLISVIPMQLGLLQRSWCLDHGWGGSEPFWRACYSDLPNQAVAGNLFAGLGAYLTGSASAPHPVVTSSVMALVGNMVPSGSPEAKQRAYFLIFAALAALLMALTTWLVAAARPRHPDLALQVALAPVVALAALVSSDVIGVALCTAALWAWSRNRPALTGALIGVAALARTYPLLMLVAVVAIALQQHRRDQVMQVLSGALIAVAAVIAPFAVLSPGNVVAPYETWWRAAANNGSPWFVPQAVTSALPGQQVSLGITATTALAVAGMAAAAVAGILLVMRAPLQRQIAPVLLVMVSIVMITGKSFPVQESLWLVPLAALAGLRWRDVLIWSGIEAAYFVSIWLYLGGLETPEKGLPGPWYSVFLLLRVAAVAYLGYRAWQIAMRDGEDAIEVPPAPMSPTDAELMDPAATLDWVSEPQRS